MTPEAFAARIPTLWRLAAAGSLAPIRTYGLRCARSLAALAGKDLPNTRRGTALMLTLPDGTSARITDNSPLSDARLERVALSRLHAFTHRIEAAFAKHNAFDPVGERDCAQHALAGRLDDGLTPADWMEMLNARIFFWPDPRLGLANLAARRRFGYASEWHVFDTARLLTPVWDRAEIAPFNTGATLRQPPRRGRTTFATLAELDYPRWRRARRSTGRIKGLDTVKEITVRGDIPHAAEALLDIHQTE